MVDVTWGRRKQLSEVQLCTHTHLKAAGITTVHDLLCLSYAYCTACARLLLHLNNPAVIMRCTLVTLDAFDVIFL
jgi:hypothetical protein